MDLNFSLLFLGGTVSSTWAGDAKKGRKIVKEQCSVCHKFKGKPQSRFLLKAPDLMWGGAKFQRAWLIEYLTGKKGKVYSKGYRWDKPQKSARHMILSAKDAKSVADYFDKNLKDPRVKKNALDLSHFTEMEASLGEKIFKEHSCIACHQIEEDGKNWEGRKALHFMMRENVLMLTGYTGLI